LESAGGRGVELHLEGRLAELFKNIAAVIAKVGGLAYGGLSSELTPEQAGKILGISRRWSSGAWTTDGCRSGTKAPTADANLRTFLCSRRRRTSRTRR